MTEAHLSDRQLQLLRLRSNGAPIKDAAARAGITEQTAKNHLHAAYTALGVSTLVEAYAALGWLEIPKEIADQTRADSIAYCSTIWNGCECRRAPHDDDRHVWTNTLDYGRAVDPALYPPALAPADPPVRMMTLRVGPTRGGRRRPAPADPTPHDHDFPGGRITGCVCDHPPAPADPTADLPVTAVVAAGYELADAVLEWKSGATLEALALKYREVAAASTTEDET